MQNQRKKATMSSRPVNPYSTYIVYDKRVDRNTTDFLSTLLSKSDDKNTVLSHKISYDNPEDDKHDRRYIICMKKEYNDLICDDNEFLTSNGLAIRRFNPRFKKLDDGLTYSYYIKTDKISTERVRSIFQSFEDKGFLQKNSYDIITPEPYPDGSSRNYIAVVFRKIEGTYPRSYIRKMKALLDNMEIDGEKLQIKWLSHSVLRDITKGEKKQKKEATK
jgi:hypothetical protein